MMVFSHRRLLIVAGATFAWLLGALAASAQTPSLGDVAKKEEARRKTAKPAEKVLTNKDLPQVSSPPPPPQPSEPAAAAEAPKAEPDKTTPEKPEKPEKDEAWWRGRITEARDALARDQVLLDALQARVNGLTTDFAGRDDPYQRARVGEDRQKALGEMERVRADIARLKKSIEDIEEEARKAGVPPGWLR
jgi:hypothetical protein